MRLVYGTPSYESFYVVPGSDRKGVPTGLEADLILGKVVVLQGSGAEVESEEWYRESQGRRPRGRGEDTVKVKRLNSFDRTTEGRVRTGLGPKEVLLPRPRRTGGRGP